jgi:hypothetical protein
MAFKKKKAPSKKKKSKSSARNRDEWAFDGGSGAHQSSDSKSSRDGEQRKGPRRTQARDEVLRRGKRKVEDRKRQRETSNKFSKKIRFSDILGLDASGAKDKSPGADTEGQHGETAARPHREQKRSNLSVLERLERFLTPRAEASKGDNGADGTDDDEGDDERDDDDEYEWVGGDDGDHNDGDDGDDDMMKEDDASISDADSATDEDREEGGEEASDGNLSWFFTWDPSSQPTASTSTSNSGGTDTTKGAISKKPQKLSLFRDLEFYGSITSPVAIESRISTLGRIPGIYKLWRSRRREKISELGSHLIPYLTHFTDMLVEGRDHHNDSDMIQSVLTHVCTHVVQSRFALNFECAVSYFNQTILPCSIVFCPTIFSMQHQQLCSRIFIEFRDKPSIICFAILDLIRSIRRSARPSRVGRTSRLRLFVYHPRILQHYHM